MKNFLVIVTKAKKLSKPELKEFIEEWEVKLKENSASALENELADNTAEQAQKQAIKHRNRDERTLILPKINNHKSQQESEEDCTYQNEGEGVKESSIIDDKNKTTKKTRIHHTIGEDQERQGKKV